MDTELLNATVVERVDLNDELSVVRVQPDCGLVPDFTPGQFVTLALPRDHSADPRAPAGALRSPSSRARLIRRAYSIASSPDTRDSMEFLVVLVRGGKLTPRLWTVEQGGRLWMNDRVEGEFTLKGVPADKELVMISTGTGIAPFMSMLRTYRGQSRWRRFVMINGARRATDLAYRQELERVAREDPGIVYISTVTREPEDSEWRGLRGRVQALLEDEVYQRTVGTPLEPQEAHVFLCGNPVMIKSVQALLEVRGFQPHTRRTPGNIHFERYW